MRRVLIAFLLAGVIASCKKSTEPDTGPGTGSEPTPTPESTVVYFGLDSTFVYRDSLYIFSSDSSSIDTVKRTFFDGITSGGFYLVPFRDSTYSSGQVRDDTFKVSGDTLYLKIRFAMDTVSLGLVLDYLIGVKPLAVGQSWTPITPAVYPLTDSLLSPQTGCTLYVYFDSLSVDSSFANVLDTTTVTTPLDTYTGVYRVIYRHYLMLYFHTTGCFTLNGTADIAMRDTSYFKTYYGLVRSDVFTRIISLVSTDSTKNHRVLIGR